MKLILPGDARTVRVRMDPAEIVDRTILAGPPDRDEPPIRTVLTAPIVFPADRELS